MTLRTRGLVALGVILGCAALLAGLLGGEQLLMRLHGHASQDGVAFLMLTAALFAAAVVLAGVALVSLYVATRSPSAGSVPAKSTAKSTAAAHHHHAVTL